MRDNLAAARAVLKKHSMMLLTASKAYVRHPELAAAKANRDFVLRQVRKRLFWNLDHFMMIQLALCNLIPRILRNIIENNAIFHYDYKIFLACKHLDWILILMLTLVMQCIYEIGEEVFCKPHPNCYGTYLNIPIYNLIEWDMQQLLHVLLRSFVTIVFAGVISFFNL